MIILYYTLPITGMASEPLVIEGVVLQTTSQTCAPASIATLARLVGLDPNLSEFVTYPPNLPLDQKGTLVELN